MFRVRTAVALVAAALSGACLSSLPLPDVFDPDVPGVQVRQSHYEIRGSSVATLLEQMEEEGPELDGRDVFALTEWRLGWEAKVSRRRGYCSVHRVDVETDISITLPRWEPPPEADPELVEQWDAFYRAVREHEKGHRDRVVEGAAAILESVSRLQGGPCDLLRRQIETEADRHLERVEIANQTYDRKTRYGAAQGARWPPEIPEAADASHAPAASDAPDASP